MNQFSLRILEMRKSSQEKIKFHFLTPRFYFPRRLLLKSFLNEVFIQYSKPIEAVNFIFCSDEYLLSINQNYLQHNTYTDIITFELSVSNAPVVSDIYISIDRVRENSKSFGQTFEKELHRIIFHGVLHLLGFKDKKVTDIKIMRKMEDSLLSKYFVSREID